MRRVWEISALLVVFTAAVFWQVRGFEFTSYDDTFFVTDNAHVLSGLTRESIPWAFTSIEAFWHPLTWLSHMLDVELYGAWAGGHHLTNLFWHLAGVVLLLWAWFRLTGDLWPSALVAALFALHPLHAESVSWVSERKGVLSSFFWIATVWSYAGYAKRPGVGRYLLVTLALCLGLMSKPTLVTLPCVLLLLDYWPLARLRLGTKEPSSAWPAPCEQRAWYGLLLEKLPWFLLVAVASGIAVLAEEETGALNWLPDVTFTSRVSNALVVYVLYLAKFFWPSGLMFFYPHPGNEIPEWAALGSGALLLTVLVLVIWQARRRPYLLVGWLWYLGTLVPVIGLVQVGGHRMADRYTDLPLIGVSVMLGWGLAELCRKVEGAAASVISGGVVALLLLGGMSWHQAASWRNSVTLYQHALKIDPKNWVALSNYGLLLDELKEYPLAMEMHKRAIQANPRNPAAGNNLANALLRDGQADEAIACLKALLVYDPDYYLAESNLGVAYTKLGQPAEAEKHFLESLRLGGEVAGIHRNYGVFLAKEERVGEAVAQFREAVRLQPDGQDDYYNLALTLLNNGRYPEAVKTYSDLIQNWPKLADAYQGRAKALAASGKVQEALRDYRRTLELNPRSQVAALELAWILATSPEDNLRDGEFAVKLSEQVCAETGFQSARALDTLAASCAEVGKFARAVDLARRAIERAKQERESNLPKQIEARLKLYEIGQPFRESPSAPASKG